MRGQQIKQQHKIHLRGLMSYMGTPSTVSRTIVKLLVRVLTQRFK